MYWGDIGMDVNKDIVNMNEDDMVEFAIECIGEAVSNNNLKQISSYINQINNNVRNLLIDCNKDMIICLIDKLYNRLVSNFPSIRMDVCERLDEDLTIYMSNIEYEKYVLKEVRKYLKYCSRRHEYDDLTLSFGILIAILILHNDRTDRMKTSIDVWECGISGIRYIPVSRNDKIDELKESIDSSLNVLTRKK